MGFRVVFPVYRVFRVEGFGIWGLGSRVSGLGFRIEGFRVCGLGLGLIFRGEGGPRGGNIMALNLSCVKPGPEACHFWRFRGSGFGLGF